MLFYVRQRRGGFEILYVNANAKCLNLTVARITYFMYILRILNSEFSLNHANSMLCFCLDYSHFYTFALNNTNLVQNMCILNTRTHLNKKIKFTHLVTNRNYTFSTSINLFAKTQGYVIPRKTV